MNQVIQGDCLEVLKGMPDNSVDALLSDPPAGISFMGKQWDGNKSGMIPWINWMSEVMAEAMRVMKPGAIGLVWSIPRTSHWTGMALEMAGFKIIDIVHHANGSGFPKGQDIGKMIDAIAGAEREVVGRRTDGRYAYGFADNSGKVVNTRDSDKSIRRDDIANITAPATAEAKQWDGWKTPALKPSVEGWWLVQKPISESSIARNILKWGTGGLHVEAGRVGGECTLRINGKTAIWADGGMNSDIGGSASGRYPANLLLSCSAKCNGGDHADGCPVTVIGGQSGSVSQSSYRPNKPNHGQGSTEGRIYQKGVIHQKSNNLGYVDSGTAARYFKQLPFDPDTTPSVYYTPKASPSDRSCNGAVDNVHPTVKSTHLCEYFAKLITPPGGTILDPFGGSGSTALGAIAAGFNYCLIEKEAEYVAIARARIAARSPQPVTPSIEERVAWLETQMEGVKRSQKRQQQQIKGMQLSLFEGELCG